MEDCSLLRFTIDNSQKLLIIVGGLVALYEYHRFRRYGAKSQWTLDYTISPIQTSKGCYLLDIRPKVTNVGRVRQYFPLIEVWANTLSEQDIKVAKDKGKLKLRRRVLQKTNIVKDPNDPYFVDPNVTQVFSHTALISEPGEYLQVVARFFYKISWIHQQWLLYSTLCNQKKIREMREHNPQCWQWKKKKLARLRRYGVWNFHIASEIKLIPPLPSMESEEAG